MGTELTAAVEGPVDRALLHAFVESLGESAGPVADAGCGPGRVAAFLSARGIDIVGVDVSPAMLAVARDAHPTIRGQDAAVGFGPRGEPAWKSLAPPG